MVDDDLNSARRTVLKTLGAAAAVFGATGVVSAGGKSEKDDHDTHDSGEDDAKDKDGDGDLEAPIPGRTRRGPRRGGLGPL